MARLFQQKRLIANLGFVAGTALMLLITRRSQSAVTFVLPYLAVRWMISREEQIARQEPGLPTISRWTRIRLFIVLPAISVCLIAFWLPNYSKGSNLWVTYGGASFALGLLLVKLYERFLLIRRRLSSRYQRKAGVA